MRGIPGAGKSYTAHALLQKYGGTPEGNIFSTDTWFHPVTNKLRSIGHVSSESISEEKAFELCEEVSQFWYGLKWSKEKLDAEDAFVLFKKAFDKFQYHEALNIAQQASHVFELLEYRNNWHGSKLKKAHGDNLTRFKQAVDQGVTPVIVDNTNIVADRMKPYAIYANDAGYKIEIHEPNSPHWLAHREFLNDKYQNKEKLDQFAKLLADKNQHGVPYESITNMIAQWQNNVKVKDLLEP